MSAGLSTQASAETPTIYKMGGTGDGAAINMPHDTPPMARTIPYPATVDNMPGSVATGEETLIRTLNSNPGEQKTVYGFSQSALIGNRAAESGRLKSHEPTTFVLTANPARPGVGSQRGGIARFATQYGLPQLQGPSTDQYPGLVVNRCAEGDPICDPPDLSQLTPEKVVTAGLNYYNIHLGKGPFNYNTLDERRVIVTKRGNRVDKYYLKPGNPAPRRPAAAPAPALAPTPAAAEVPTPAAAPATAPVVPVETSQPPVAPPVAAPLETTAPATAETVANTADTAVAVAPQFAPQIRQAEKDISRGLNDLGKLVPGLLR